MTQKESIIIPNIKWDSLSACVIQYSKSNHVYNVKSIRRSKVLQHTPSPFIIVHLQSFSNAKIRIRMIQCLYNTISYHMFIVLFLWYYLLILLRHDRVKVYLNESQSWVNFMKLKESKNPALKYLGKFSRIT